MKRIHLLSGMIFTILLLVIGCKDASSSKTTNVRAPKTFDIHRGVNISHWLSQSRKRGPERTAYFTEEDVAAIATAGFDHIRIPIDEVHLWDEQGNKHQEAFDLLHQALQWMSKHQLKAIVDLHIIRSHYFLDEDPPLFKEVAEQDKFADMWRQLSQELSAYPNDMVAYELLNESVAQDHRDWNKVFRVAYEAVRQLEPERVIFLGPNRWQNAQFFPHLDVPENDLNIVLSFHFYTPHIITHYKTSWNEIRHYEGPIHYPGVSIQPADTLGLPDSINTTIRQYTTKQVTKDSLANMMSLALDKAKETGLQLYCGEFGCYHLTPNEIRLRWYRDVIDLLDTNDIAWSAWDYKSNGFGVFKAADGTLSIPEDVLNLVD